MEKVTLPAMDKVTLPTMDKVTLPTMDKVTLPFRARGEVLRMRNTVSRAKK